MVWRFWVILKAVDLRILFYASLGYFLKLGFGHLSIVSTRIELQNLFIEMDRLTMIAQFLVAKGRPIFVAGLVG